METPRFAPISEFELLRGERDCELIVDGLWTCGTISALQRPCVAIVGTRAATSYGRRIAHAFAAELAAAGCCIVSGLALGIDACAHEGALDAGGTTVGILGSGHAAFFPPRNAQLAERMIAGGGAVLSPFPPGQRAERFQFLQRNGIVAALSDAVVVIEAPKRSGALNTAGWAAGRIPVFAVPGDVDRPHVAGCHALLRDGAILARSAADVLEVLGTAQPRLPLRESPPRDPLAAALLDALASGDASLESLAERTGIATAELLAALTVLELDGAVERTGALYARGRAASLLS